MCRRGPYSHQSRFAVGVAFATLVRYSITILGVLIVFGVLGVDCLEVLDVEGPDDRDDVLQAPDSLERAEEIGRRMVHEVRSSAG